MKQRLREFTCDEILTRLRGQANPENVAGMARFGINSAGTLGIAIPVLRGLSKEVGRDHTLAESLWASGIHEARILASMIDEPASVTEDQMERWVLDFDSWDVCDQVCGNLFDKTSFAHHKAVAWSFRDEEFVKRAGYTLMATIAVHDKRADDHALRQFFPHIIRGANDPRNFVKKAVNWALRQIGKRNRNLLPEALRIAEDLAASSDKTARWVGKDAVRELSSR